ncbi:hypothetical protein [Verrucosispora sp. WMMC514]|uniref:hypothetical protein n=1 Tax=Verrucosispora sp. WMMC514 TaxID=3015156 RepID=UPI00248AC9E1|nr:hypothetical protein [Verrucosispora sp. WMMC514]WBB94469.1 hypothetical protein O7597_10425 [Verrucosispora sp. WMMC514]
MISVEASNVSTAWLSVAGRLDGEPKRKAIHTVVRIVDPVAETSSVREAMDALLAAKDLPSVDTVANTIFPAAIASSSRDHAELVQRYVRMYPLLQKRFPQNRRGTYFHRLIQYPGSDGPFDQIGAVISRIRTERDGGNPKQARYETALAVADDAAANVPVYIPGRDNNAMAFPCLSHCSFQLDTEGRVHLLATYRSQYLVQRGYGNYLALGQLLAHVAEQTGLQVGHLTVVAGRAHLEPPVVPVRGMLARFAELT